MSNLVHFASSGETKCSWFFPTSKIFNSTSAWIPAGISSSALRSRCSSSMRSSRGQVQKVSGNTRSPFPFKFTSRKKVKLPEERGIVEGIGRKQALGKLDRPRFIQLIHGLDESIVRWTSRSMTGRRHCCWISFSLSINLGSWRMEFKNSSVSSSVLGSSPRIILLSASRNESTYSNPCWCCSKYSGGSGLSANLRIRSIEQFEISVGKCWHWFDRRSNRRKLWHRPRDGGRNRKALRAHVSSTRLTKLWPNDSGKTSRRMSEQLKIQMLDRSGLDQREDSAFGWWTDTMLFDIVVHWLSCIFSAFFLVSCDCKSFCNTWSIFHARSKTFVSSYCIHWISYVTHSAAYEYVSLSWTWSISFIWTALEATKIECCWCDHEEILLLKRPLSLSNSLDRRFDRWLKGRSWFLCPTRAFATIHPSRWKRGFRFWIQLCCRLRISSEKCIQMRCLGIHIRIRQSGLTSTRMHWLSYRCSCSTGCSTGCSTRENTILWLLPLSLCTVV